jgi:hypothetical protein
MAILFEGIVNDWLEMKSCVKICCLQIISPPFPNPVVHVRVIFQRSLQRLRDKEAVSIVNPDSHPCNE